MNKNKYIECIKILKDIEKTYDAKMLNKNRKFILAKISLFYRTKNDKGLALYIDELA